MSAPVIFNLKDPRAMGLESQLADIFFESSTKKEFKDAEERRAFEWKYLGFYLSHYPEYAWVAVEEHKLLGYVLGMPFSQDPSLYQIQPHMKKFEAEFMEFPAHLHINCHADARGKGIGSKLVQTLLNQLTTEHIKGLHIMTGPASENRHFYHKLGFDFELEKEQILFMGKSL